VLLEELVHDIGLSEIIVDDHLNASSLNEFNNSSKDNLCPGYVRIERNFRLHLLIKKDNETLLVSGRPISSETNPWHLGIAARFAGPTPFLIKTKAERTLVKKDGTPLLVTYEMVKVVSPDQYSYIIAPHFRRTLPKGYGLHSSAQ
jgi:hypothetical protein